MASLRHRVRVNGEHTVSPAEHGTDHVLLGCPLDTAHVENDSVGGGSDALDGQVRRGWGVGVLTHGVVFRVAASSLSFVPNCQIVRPCERVRRILLGLAAAIAGIVLIAPASSVVAVVLELLLIAAGLDMLVTGATGRCPRYEKLGHPKSLRSTPMTTH